jgi:L-malate glycosyltransferase
MTRCDGASGIGSPLSLGADVPLTGRPSVCGTRPQTLGIRGRKRGQANGPFKPPVPIQSGWLESETYRCGPGAEGRVGGAEQLHLAVPGQDGGGTRDVDRRKPRICHLLEGTTVADAEELSARLVHRFRSDYDFTLVTLGEPGPVVAELRREGHPVHVITQRPGLDWRCSQRLARVLRDRQVDLVHAHQSRALYFALIARLFYRNPPILLTEHVRRQPDNVSARRLVVSRMFLESRDRIVAASLSVRQALLLNEGIPSEQVEVIYHGVVPPPTVADGDRESVRRELGVESDSFLILQIARFEPSQNHVLAIHTLEQVVRSLPGTRLALIGNGPEERMIRELVRQRRLESHVLFLGSRPDHSRLLVASDLVLQTGDHGGDLSVLIQALAMERPVVATRVGGVDEVVEDRTCGLIASQGDYGALGENILRLGASPALRKQFGSRGRQRVDQMFSEANTSHRYSTMYSRMLSR